MSLTTHSPQEPCVGHCATCGAFADWSELITDLLDALKEIHPSLLAAIIFIEGVFPEPERSTILREELISHRMREMKARVTINRVRSLLPEERKEN